MLLSRTDWILLTAAMLLPSATAMGADFSGNVEKSTAHRLSRPNDQMSQEMLQAGVDQFSVSANAPTRGGVIQDSQFQLHEGSATLNPLAGRLYFPAQPLPSAACSDSDFGEPLFSNTAASAPTLSPAVDYQAIESAYADAVPRALARFRFNLQAPAVAIRPPAAAADEPRVYADTCRCGSVIPGRSCLDARSSAIFGASYGHATRSSAPATFSSGSHVSVFGGGGHGHR